MCRPVGDAPSCGMDFSAALALMREGAQLTRTSWFSGEHVEMQFPDVYSRMGAPYPFMSDAHDVRLPWLPSAADLMAFDWAVLGTEDDYLGPCEACDPPEASPLARLAAQVHALEAQVDTLNENALLAEDEGLNGRLATMENHVARLVEMADEAAVMKRIMPPRPQRGPLSRPDHEMDAWRLGLNRPQAAAGEGLMGFSQAFTAMLGGARISREAGPAIAILQSPCGDKTPQIASGSFAEIVRPVQAISSLDVLATDWRIVA
jgi:hypothetical protein